MTFLRTIVLLVVTAVGIASCGGGGGGLASFSPSPGGGGGIGGSGITSSGEITSFGSIFVNGIEFDTDTAEIEVNGERVDEDALGLGMVVLVEGTINEDGRTGVAERVVFDGAVRGPVESASISEDGNALTLRVLGIAVVVDRRTAVVAGTAFEDIQENDLVEVSGFADTDGVLRATRLERIEAFVPNESAIDRQGNVDNLDGTTFTLGDLTVDAATADLTALPGGSLAANQPVLVSGTLVGTTITAETIEPTTDLRTVLPADEQLVVQGLVSDLAGNNRFTVNAIPVDAGNANFELTSDALRNGLLVQVTGTWNGETLIAETVSSREGDILVAASIGDIDAGNDTVELDILQRGLAVTVTSLTLIEDGTGQTTRPTLDALRAGDYVVVEANARGDALAALRISRSRPRDNALRGEIESITSGVSIAVQGVTIDTAEVAFLDASGEALTPRAFYEQASVGDRVLVIDRQPANGIADIVRRLDEASIRR